MSVQTLLPDTAYWRVEDWLSSAQDYPLDEPAYGWNIYRILIKHPTETYTKRFFFGFYFCSINVFSTSRYLLSGLGWQWRLSVAVADTGSSR